VSEEYVEGELQRQIVSLTVENILKAKANDELRRQRDNLKEELIAVKYEI